jgi:hypothetical protein
MFNGFWGESPNSPGDEAEPDHLDEFLSMLEGASLWPDGGAGAAFRAEGWGGDVPTLLTESWSLTSGFAAQDDHRPAIVISAPVIALPEASPFGTHSTPYGVDSCHPSVGSPSSRVGGTCNVSAAVFFRDAVDAGNYLDYLALPNVSDPPEGATPKAGSDADPPLPPPPLPPSEAGDRNSGDRPVVGISEATDEDSAEEDGDDEVDPLAAWAAQFTADVAATELALAHASEAAALLAESSADAGLRVFEQLVDGVEGALYFGEVSAPGAQRGATSKACTEETLSLRNSREKK